MHTAPAMDSESPDLPKPARTRLRTGARLLAVVALLALVIGLVGPADMAAQLRRTSLPWFAAAVLCAIAANLVSAWRWGVIARALGLRAPLGALVSAYAQGIAVNTVLPGATLGGDALRALRLAQAGNDGLLAGASVVLDRASGLWVLCVLSLLASLMLLASGTTTGVAAGATLSLPMVGLLAALLLGALSLPFVIAPGPAPSRRPRWRQRWHELRALLHARRHAMGRSLLPSMVVQVLSAATLWLCARAAGAEISAAAVMAVGAPVFLAAAIPVSVGGFGPREAVAALAFPWIGAAPEVGVAAALLYGLAAAVQGAVGAPLLALAPPQAVPQPERPTDR